MRRSNSPALPVTSAWMGAEKGQRLGVRRQVMDLAVGQEDGAADTGGWHVGGRRLQGLEEFRRGRVAVAGIGDFDDAGSRLGKRARRSRKPASASSVLCRAAGDLLALAAVNDDGHDCRQRIALFLEEERIGQRCEHREGGGEADGGAAQAAQEAEDRETGGETARMAMASQGMKGANSSVMSLPNRSRRAGTCTWSAL